MTGEAGDGGSGGGAARASAPRRLVDWGKGLWSRVSARRWVAHLLRAGSRFSDRLGNQFAAAITYFSFLSLVPIVMVAFSIAGLVLRSSPDTLASLKAAVAGLIPVDSSLIDQAVGQSVTVGILGLVIAAYSGLSWMGNVRDALRAQWRPEWKKPEHAQGNFLMRYVWDLVTLAGLAVAIVISFGLTAVGTAAQQLVMGWLGIAEGTWAAAVLQVGPFVVAIATGTVTFAWIYTMLPDRMMRADRATLLKGALAMSIVFEILKSALALLVGRMTSSPTGVVFGSIIGLLLFFNLVARAFLMVGAWIATATEHHPSGPRHRDPGTSGM